MNVLEDFVYSKLTMKIGQDMLYTPYLPSTLFTIYLVLHNNDYFFICDNYSDNLLAYYALAKSIKLFFFT